MAQLVKIESLRNSRELQTVCQKRTAGTKCMTIAGIGNTNGRKYRQLHCRHHPHSGCREKDFSRKVSLVQLYRNYSLA